MKVKENNFLVYNYVKEHQAENITADDIANALGLNPRTVNGIITMSFQRHKDEDKNEVPLMVRETGEPYTDEKGKPKVAKYIRLTPAGEAIEIEMAEA